MKVCLLTTRFKVAKVFITLSGSYQLTLFSSRQFYFVLHLVRAYVSYGTTYKSIKCQWLDDLLSHRHELLWEFLDFWSPMSNFYLKERCRSHIFRILWEMEISPTVFKTSVVKYGSCFFNTSSIFCAIVTKPFVGLWFGIGLKSFASSTIIYYTVWIWISSISLTVLSQNGCQLTRNKYSTVFFSVDFTISANWTDQSDEWRSKS